MSRRRRQLGGIQSRGNLAVARRAIPLGGVQSRTNLSVARRAVPLGGVPDWYREQQLTGVPDWYRQMQGSSLGDDTLGAMTTEQFQAEMLASQKALLAAGKQWAEGDKLQKWIAIGATLAIPLSAAIWRALGIGRRRRP